MFRHFNRFYACVRACVHNTAWKCIVPWKWHGMARRRDFLLRDQVYFFPRNVCTGTSTSIARPNAKRKGYTLHTHTVLNLLLWNALHLKLKLFSIMCRLWQLPLPVHIIMSGSRQQQSAANIHWWIENKIWRNKLATSSNQRLSLKWVLLPPPLALVSAVTVAPSHFM